MSSVRKTLLLLAAHAVLGQSAGLGSGPDTELQRARKLREERRYDEARTALEPLFGNEELRAASPQLYESAVLEWARLVDARCSELEGAGRRALEQDDLAAAQAGFEALVRCRAESPFVGVSEIERGVEPRLFEFMSRVETRLHESAIALQAFGQWRAGEAASAERTIASSASVRAQYVLLVALHAERLFGRQEWVLAATAYEQARMHGLRGRSGVYDAEIGRLQYNQAMAEHNAGRDGNAQRLLRELQARLPSFRRDLVARALAALRPMER